MEQKLDFLRQYFSDNVKLIPCSEMLNVHYKEIPRLWFELFSEKKGEERIECILSIWKRHVAEELRITISFLSQHLEEVELIKVDDDTRFYIRLKRTVEKRYFMKEEIQTIHLTMRC